MAVKMVGAPLLLAAGWELLRAAGLFDAALLPSSLRILRALLSEAAQTELWLDLAYTLWRSLGGLALAIVIGVPVGLLIGSSRLLRPIGMPLIDFMRSIPVTTLYPVFVLTLGIGDRGKIGMVFLGCMLIVALNAAAGFEGRSRIRYDIARLYGGTRSDLLVHVSLYEALPSILTGVRVAVGIALIISTLTEMFMGADLGMGQTLMERYSIYDLSGMYAYIVALGIAGFILNRAGEFLEDRTQRWKGGE